MPPYIFAALALFLAISLPPAPEALAAGLGRLLIAGNGPEQRMIQQLAAEFEKANPGTVVEIEWDRNLKALEMVKAGHADLAVTGEEDPELAATSIAWDGIAVIVNFSNPIQELTTQQVAGIFTGEITSWAEIGGPEAKIDIIHRPPDRNIRAGFEQALGIAGKAVAAKTIRSDQKALSTVAGNLSAISYISLGPSLEALQFGIPIRALLIDGVEAAEPTVKTGQYPLRRPVFLVGEKDSNPAQAAFIAFARSPKGQRIVDEIFVPYGP
ncbi:MAG: hypothetical protein C4293_15850 [Nitrospiraceae bacterium]